MGSFGYVGEYSLTDCIKIILNHQLTNKYNRAKLSTYTYLNMVQPFRYIYEIGRQLMNCYYKLTNKWHRTKLPTYTLTGFGPIGISAMQVDSLRIVTWLSMNSHSMVWQVPIVRPYLKVNKKIRIFTQVLKYIFCPSRDLN